MRPLGARSAGQTRVLAAASTVRTAPAGAATSLASPIANACGAGLGLWHYQAVEIAAVDFEIPGVATYQLAFCDPAAGAAYRFAPGQFNMLYVPGAGEAAISISGETRAPDGSPLRLAHTIRTAGVVTGALAQMECGGSLGLRGPFGVPWPLESCRGRDVIVAAGGIGLAPLRAAIEQLAGERDAFGRLTLLYGARTPDLLLYPADLESWRRRGWDVQLIVDRATPGWAGEVGVVPSLIERLQPLCPARTSLLTCGPEVMMRFSALAALRRGLPAEHVWLSMERNMQCAIGLCGHCQWGPEFVCKDGPVFSYDRIARYLTVEAL